MISRLTASAALFAVLATIALTFATETHAQRSVGARVAAADPSPQAIVTLPPVLVIGKRSR